MKKLLFRFWVRLNNLLLPKFSGKDPAQLHKWQLVLLGYRYWVLKHAL